MPDIDVTELFDDPDFASPFVLIRRTSKVGDDGVNQVIEEEMPEETACILPVSNAMRRLPNFDYVEGMMEIWYRGELVTTGEDRMSDIIEWGMRRGKPARYQVMSVDDWLDWGEGWTHAVLKPIWTTPA